jgi:hypothetical protein
MRAQDHLLAIMLSHVLNLGLQPAEVVVSDLEIVV